MAAIEEGQLRVDGVSVFYRRLPGEGTPTVYCHGNPTHGEDWLPFLERGGGPAIAIDMPGWGRSDHPGPAAFDYSMYGLSAFLERCLERLDIGRRNLVVHDWGCLALIGAQRRPELVEKLVVINAVPLLPGFRWHWVAQIWRRRGLGELANATTTKASMGLIMRQVSGDRRPMPPQFIDMIWGHLDHGTNQATLALYRHADPTASLSPVGSSAASPAPPWSSGAPTTPSSSPASPRPTRWPFPTLSSSSSRAPATGPGSTMSV